MEHICKNLDVEKDLEKPGKANRQPQEKRNFYKLNYFLIVLYFILKSIDVLFTGFLIINYGLEGETNPVTRLIFGKFGIDIFIFYVPIVGLLIYNYYYRKDLFLMRVEFFGVSAFLVVLYLVIFNNLVAILVRS